MYLQKRGTEKNKKKVRSLELPVLIGEVKRFLNVKKVKQEPLRWRRGSEHCNFASVLDINVQTEVLMNFMKDTAFFDLMYTIIIKGHTTSPYERHKGDIGFVAKNISSDE